MLRREVYKRGEPHHPPLLAAAGHFALLALALAVVPYFVALAMCGCSVHDVEQPFKDVGADIAEVSYCEVEHCGSVFLCETTLPYGDTLTPELCWMDDNAGELATALSANYGYTSCEPTPRGGSLGWPCLYCCGAHCGRGANAYQGALCE